MRVGLAVLFGGEDDGWVEFTVVLGGDEWLVLTLYNKKTIKSIGFSKHSVCSA